MRPGVREAVLAWEAAIQTRDALYKSSGEKIHAMLTRVGGYATTSAKEAEGHEGHCQSYHVADEGWPGMGVERIGEAFGGTGPHKGKVAPYEPETGDAIKTLDLAYRASCFAANAAEEAVTKLVKDLTSYAGVGRVWLAPVMRALVLDDEKRKRR